MVVLVLTALLLCSISFLQQFYLLYLSSMVPHRSIWICLLDVNCEANFPTWFSSSLLLLCSIVLGAITYEVKKKYDRPFLLHWGILSAIFALLSVMEAVPVHEGLVKPVRDWLHVGGLFYYAWVIPGGVLVIVFVLSYLRFVFVGLDSKFRWLFVSAGLIYVSGGLGVEMIGGLQADLHGTSNLTYSLLVTIEELLEMLGASLFLYALMLYTKYLEL